MTRVTFIKHSGFYVETEKSCLLFDYWRGDLPEIPSEKDLYIFASHAHHDHYSKNIFKLENVCSNVHFILSADIKEADDQWKKVSDLTFMDAYETKIVGNCKICTLKSTDIGVAFVVEVDGKRFYHAGDLHDWDWPGEPEEENRLSTENYRREIDSIKDIPFDAAFVVLDPRQEYAGGKGMDYFLQNIRSRVVFPMHLWGEFAYLQEYTRKNQKKYLMTQIMKIQKCNQTFILE